MASVLHDAGLGTLLLDLLTPSEEVSRATVFDIALLAQRLGAATRWLGRRQDGWGGRIGHFGASTGAGAALWAAGEPHANIAVVVSRGDRPDSTGARLAAVRGPRFADRRRRGHPVACSQPAGDGEYSCTTWLEIVPGATDLFEEPGVLARVAALAAAWFNRNPLPSRPGENTQELLP